ncbi:hypothetical protein KW494_10005 [Vibrio fluvialis]|nr:hypothetical protein [Vibrio fluvialis]MBY8294986.1 hypothetical protein [Vibrio fluvialis]MBY8311704.1 hypothetical protein [Vibrio fluvialis]
MLLILGIFTKVMCHKVRLIIFYIVIANLLTLSMVSAFAITPLVTIPFVMSGMLIGASFFYLIYKMKVWWSLQFSLFMAFIISASISALIMSTSITTLKPLNHYISFVISILFAYSLFFSLCETRDKFNAYNLSILIGVLFTCAFGIYEFYIKQILSQYINILPRPDDVIYYPTTFGFMYRIRSFSVESGHLASFLFSMFALVLPYVKEKVSLFLQYVIFTIVFITLILTFSTAGYISVFFALLLVYVFSIISNPKKYGKNASYAIIFIILIAMSLEFLFVQIFNYSMINDLIINKLTNSGSVNDRLNKFGESYDLFMSGGLSVILFGLGPGYFLEHSDILAVISLYATVLFQYGLIGLILFTLPFVLCIWKLSKKLLNKSLPQQDVFLCKCYQFSLLYSLIHFSAISNYWYPWFWVSLVVPLVFLTKDSSVSINK